MELYLKVADRFLFVEFEKVTPISCSCSLKPVLCQTEDYLHAPGISEGRETEYCKTKTSMKFGYFEVVTYARYVVTLFML